MLVYVSDADIDTRNECGLENDQSKEQSDCDGIKGRQLGCESLNVCNFHRWKLVVISGSHHPPNSGHINPEPSENLSIFKSETVYVTV